MNESPTNSPWLSRFAWLTAGLTLILISVGGLVTSKGVGMSVPDWPTTYGYNMFLFPVSQWVGGIFYEHSHRLIGSVVGLFTALLTARIWEREAKGWSRRLVYGFILAALAMMGVRSQVSFIVMAVVALLVGIYAGNRAWEEERPLRWWALVAFCAVIVQGVLGGLRVTAMKDAIGIVHGTIAQLFLVLLCLLALCTGRFWQRLKQVASDHAIPGSLRSLLLLATLLIFAQLLLGASMRHQHAGLAVPDFPLAHGRLYPATDPDSMALYNSRRMDHREPKDIQPFHIHLHMAHRAMALVLVGMIPYAAIRVRRALGSTVPAAGQLATAWIGLIVVQAGLGVVTVLTNKPADIATLHVVVGAVTLVVGVVLTVMAREFSIATTRTVLQSRPRPLAAGAPQPQA